MAVHFTYKEEADHNDLCQGDILLRTPALEKVLEDFYPRYAVNADNKYFVVLTQSCELIRRAGGPCDARYIALAPARPLSVALSRKLADLAEDSIESEAPVCTDRNRNRLTLWMERLLNNNEPEYFFLHKAPECGLSENCCAFLALSIAVKTELRYEDCLAARILSLADAFQAKLGWLVGQMYSRVGTPDWPRDELQREVSSALKSAAIWVPDRKLDALRKLVLEWKDENPDTAIDEAKIERLLKQVPQRKQQVVERVVSLLLEKGLIVGTAETKARNLIAGDPQLSSLLKE